MSRLTASEKEVLAARIADWRADHFGCTYADIGLKFGLTRSQVETLMPLARERTGIYFVPPVKETTGSAQSDDYYFAQLRRVHAALGLGPSDSLSMGGYDKYLDGLKKTNPVTRSEFARAAVHIKRFGKWNTACALAGLPTNTPVQEKYDGVRLEDIVRWVATWLRSLRDSDTVQDATLAGYTAWAATNEAAPGPDRIKQVGRSFGEVLEHAWFVERLAPDLGVVRERSRYGILKNGVAHTVCAGMNCKEIVWGGETVCDFHADFGVDYVPERAVSTRTRTYYLVYWPDWNVFKVGVEYDSRLGHEAQRINKWKRKKAVLVGTFRLAVVDPEQSIGMFNAEKAVNNFFGEQGCQKPDRGEWLEVVGAVSKDYPERPDGYTETWVLPERNTLDAVKTVMGERLAAEGCMDVVWTDGTAGSVEEVA